MLQGIRIRRTTITEYEFTLKFALKSADANIDELVERLSEAGCTDALVGFGQPGRIGLDFTREAESAKAAVLSAMADVKRAIPDATLVEAAPDLVGLTDIANLLGFSRQNMRKLAVQASATFPPPVHEGNPTIWHLSAVLVWLKSRGTYEIADSLLEVAKANRQVNLTKAIQDTEIEPAVRQSIGRLLAA